MKKKIILLIILVIVVGLAAAGISLYLYFDDAVEQVQYDEKELEEKPIVETYDLSIVPVDGYINILLLGVDTRDMSTISKTRSDMIIIASINEETYDVTLTSIYRDTYVKVNNSYTKINHAMMWGGPDLAVATINQALGLNIEYYGIVNFKAVADIVNAVGGIEVDVQEKEIEQLNKYTKQTAKNIGQETYKLVTEPGLQTLEGVQAVSYGRIRKGVGDDFKRTERMRTVINCVFNKVRTMSFSDMKGLIEIMLPQIKTNMKTNDILALAMKLPQYSISTGSGWPYSYRCNTYNGISYVFPYDLATNVKQLHERVFGETDYQLSSTIQEMSGIIASDYLDSKTVSTKEDEQEIESSEETFLLDENGEIIRDANGNPVMVVVPKEIVVDTVVDDEDKGTTEIDPDVGVIVDTQLDN